MSAGKVYQNPVFDTLTVLFRSQGDEVTQGMKNVLIIQFGRRYQVKMTIQESKSKERLYRLRLIGSAMMILYLDRFGTYWANSLEGDLSQAN